MQENKVIPNTLELGPCLITWDWEEKDLVSCYVSYEEQGTTGYRLIGKAWARCSEEDLKKGLFSKRKGMQVSLKKALKQANQVLSSFSFRQKLWFAFRNQVGWPPKPYQPTQKETKLPKDLIGQSFSYKGENYTVVNIVWGKAPRARNPRSAYGYWKKGSEPNTRKWVEYVEYEPHRGAEQRFVRPKAEFLSKFQLIELKENVRVIEDFPDNIDPTPNLGSGLANFN